MPSYEIEVRRQSTVVSRRRLLRAEMALGARDGCDIVLDRLTRDGRLLLRRSRAGLEIFGAPRHARLQGAPVREGQPWDPGGQLEIDGYTLALQPFVNRTITHENTVEVTKRLALRAGAVRVPLRIDRPTVIGAAQADLNLAHRTVSPRHAKVEWRGGGYYVVELNSSARIRVNGRPVEGPTGARLSLGDRLTCGDVDVEVELAEDVEDHGLLGQSDAMRALRRQLEQLADKSLVTIIGETGSGKASVAHALHALKLRSGVRSGEFLPFNCSNLLPGTSRSALFGHEKHAFSDASGRRWGAFGAVEGGTLFLDRAGGLYPSVQVQLLRVLESREMGPVGGDRVRPIDTHMIVSLLPEDLDRLRADLVARLQENVLRVPPLRRRGMDVLLLAEHHLEGLGCEAKLSAGAKRILREHPWPGNVRELQSALEHMAARKQGSGSTELAAEDLVLQVQDPEKARRSFEGRALRDLLVAHHGNVSRASAAAGMSRRHFGRLLRAEGVSVREVKDELRKERQTEMRQAVTDAGGVAAAARALGMPASTVRDACGPRSERAGGPAAARSDLERRLQARDGDVAAVAEDLGVSPKTVRRQMEALRVFEASEVAQTQARLIVERAGEHDVSPIVGPGFCVGRAADNEVGVEDDACPAHFAMVVQRGGGLGLRVFGGPGVHVAGGLLLHARALEIDPGEIARVGETRVWLESDVRLPPPPEVAAEGIVVEDGDGRHVVDAKRPFVIGTDEACDLVLDDPYASRMHFRIFESGGRWHVYDCGAKNGTFVNGRPHRAGPVRVPADLRVGDTELSLEWATPRVWKKTYGFVGQSEVMQEVYRALEGAKRCRRVLITGETGTGKELAARAMHEIWGGGPLVVVNCGGVTDELLHHELVGHEKGAYTGATEAHAGYIAQAEGGTLFLDELGDMSRQSQRQLLSWLKDGMYTPGGADWPRPSDVRVVAATNRDLWAMMDSNAFERSLFYRFDTQVKLPPLRDRGAEDLQALVEYLLDQMGGWRLARGALAALEGLVWSRNVRQLRNLLAAAIRLAEQEGALEVTADLLVVHEREPGEL